MIPAIVMVVLGVVVLYGASMPAQPDEECRWCHSDCTPETSPSCYCLDCETRLVKCQCRPDCPGGNCYTCGA